MDLKPEAVRTLLIMYAVPDKQLHQITKLVPVTVSGYDDGSADLEIHDFILPPPEGPLSIQVTVTDDPTSIDAHDFRSLGHSSVRLTLNNCQFEQRKYPTFSGGFAEFFGEWQGPER